MESQSKPVLGIDLGTTYSAMAYVDEHGDAKIIPNSQNERITPSVLLFEDEENKVIVGQTAKDQAELYPDNTVAFVKREMGKLKEDVRKEENHGEPKPFNFWGKTYSPEEISAFILKKMKADAELYFNGEKINDAVITVPAYFNDSERQATKDAGTMAGLNVLHIINEPTAAAISYSLQTADGSQKAFVFDLGGGTFDVTILDIEIGQNEKEIKVINTDGDHRLGGKDWDDKIIGFISEQFINEFGDDPMEDPESLADIRDRAEKAKKQLSERESTKIIVTAFGNKMAVDLSRDQFNEFTSDLLSRCESACNMVLEDKDLSWDQIDTIILAGGSTRMPMVREMITRISGKELSPANVNPDECVALGAALQAKMLKIKDDLEDGNELSQELKDKLSGVTVRDVTCHTLGSSAYNDQDVLEVFPIIEKGKEVPIKQTKKFTTRQAFQKAVDVDVREGESRNPENTALIQEATLPIEVPREEKMPIEVTFYYNTDGILTITAKDVLNNKEIQFEVERKSNLTGTEVEDGKSNLMKVDISG